MKKLLIVLVLVAAGIGGGALWFAQKRNVPLGIPRTETVDRGPIVAKLASGGGKFSSAGLVHITTDVAVGKIQRIHPGVEVGRAVHKEQPLIDLNDTIASLNLQRAEAEVAVAKLELAKASATEAQVQNELNKAQEAQRAAKKYYDTVKDNPELARELKTKAQAALEMAEQGVKAAENGLISVRAGIEAARKKVDALQIAVQAAQAALEQTRIVSPVDGVIIDKKVIEGQLITPQSTPVLLLIAPRLEEMELVVQIGESDINKVAVGMPAQFTVDAFAERNWVFKGKVKRVAETPTTAGFRIPGLPDLFGGTGTGPVTYAVTIHEFEYPENWGTNRFRNGMTANVDIVKVLVDRPVLRVANAALAYRPGGRYLRSEDKQALERRAGSEEKPVWVWENGKSRLIFIRINPAANDGLRTEVVEPTELKEGMKVVTEDPPEPTRGGLFESPVKVGP